MRLQKGPGLALWSLGLFVALLPLFWLSDLDLGLSRLAYGPDAPHWPHQNELLWHLLYRFGEPPALALGLLGGLCFALSFSIENLRPLRRPGLYLFAVLLIGPGLLVNTFGKSMAGRPRPWETTEFGGAAQFLRPFQLDLRGPGRSFLSGHASMAFYFFSLYFVFDGAKARWALGLTLLFGTLMGIARILQGAHFLSDVLLCGILMFTVCAALSPILGSNPSRKP